MDAVCLGKFHPSHYSASIINSELETWLINKGISKARNMGKHLPIAVREPAEHLRLSHCGVISNWHRDGLGARADDPGMIPQLLWMILWSNGTPTELRGPFGILTFESHDVLLVNNQTVWHRCPPSEPDRWFARLLEPIIDAANF